MSHTSKIKIKVKFYNLKVNNSKAAPTSIGVRYEQLCDHLSEFYDNNSQIELTIWSLRAYFQTRNYDQPIN